MIEFEEISGSFSFLTSSKEFFIQEMCVAKNGLHINSSHLLRILVGNFVLDTIGCNGRFGLWIFGSPYSLGHKALHGKHLT
jgi:hypothetical protein